MTKLEKIGADLKRARAKQTVWTQRVKELESRYREEENSVIHTMVHAASLTPEQLAKVIALAGQGMVGVYSAETAEATGNKEQEEDENAY
jgi:hypothetical protein